MTRLSVVGIGEDGWAGLSPVARALVARAEVLVGGERHFALLEPGVAPLAERLPWDKPFAHTLAALAERHDKRIVVLASGDPMWFGAGATLARHFGRESVTVVPHVSAFALAAARLAWPLAEVAALSLHGRPLERLALELAPGARILALTDGGEAPAAVAAFLDGRGWGPSRLWVLEHLGGPGERRREGTAADWPQARCADLHVLAIELIPGPQAHAYPRLAGLPDDAFEHDGQITKREVRAVTLAALSPLRGQRLWDIGAGCGSIAIEWLRAERGMRAIAVERHAGRAQMIARNAARLGVPELELRTGSALDVLDGLDAPDAVFIGGGLTAAGLIERCWAALPGGGRLAANAVTLEGEAALLAAAQRHGGTLTRLAVSRAEPLAGMHVWRPLRPITQWAALKP